MVCLGRLEWSPNIPEVIMIRTVVTAFMLFAVGACALPDPSPSLAKPLEDPDVAGETNVLLYVGGKVVLPAKLGDGSGRGDGAVITARDSDIVFHGSDDQGSARLSAHDRIVFTPLVAAPGVESVLAKPKSAKARAAAAKAAAELRITAKARVDDRYQSVLLAVGAEMMVGGNRVRVMAVTPDAVLLRLYAEPAQDVVAAAVQPQERAKD